MQQTTLRTKLGARSALRPFAHLFTKAKKSSPRDSGPDDDVNKKERDGGPTDQNDPDDLDSGPDKDNDDLETKPNDADCDCDCDCDCEDADEENEKDEKAVKKARDAGHARALKAVAREARRAERTRCASIFGSRHAAGRIEQAANLAFRSLLSAPAAITALSRTPRGYSTGINSTPGQRLLAATMRLADAQMAAKHPVAPPQFAQERERARKVEFAEMRIKAQGRNVEAGLGLLRACAAAPPPKHGF